MDSPQVAAVRADIERYVETAAKALILEIAAILRRVTPVDTGHARAGWVPSIGEPFDGDANDGSYSSGVAAIVSYRLADGLLWLANNTPYIVFLNYGTSDQAPAGFFEAAVDQAQATIRARYAGAQVNVLTSSSIENIASAYVPEGLEN